MATSSGSVKGLSGIVTAAHIICKLTAIYGPIIRPLLDPAVQVAWDALIASCNAFGAVYHDHPVS